MRVEAGVRAVVSAAAASRAITMCCIISFCSVVISIIFIVGAITNVITPFTTSYDITIRAQAFMGCVMCFGTYFLATWCKNQRSSRLFTPTIRNIIANYSVTIAIVIFTVLAAFAFDDVGLATLEIPLTFAPTYNDTVLGRPRDWIVNPMGTHKPFPVWGIFFAALPALGLTILGYLDQNLTSLLINRKDHNLRKPPAYHLDLLVCGVLVYPVCSIFGLPFTHAATVRSICSGSKSPASHPSSAGRTSSSATYTFPGCSTVFARAYSRG